MGEKLIIHNFDGTTTEVEPLAAWGPGDIEAPTEWPKGSVDWAMEHCKARGYIARDAKPKKKYWKNVPDWQTLLYRLPVDDALEMDWRCFDPQEEEGPLTA